MQSEDIQFLSTVDYQRVERVIEVLGSHYRSRPSLKQLAEVAGLSPWHLQRLFTRWVGISPKRVTQYLGARLACRLLRQLPSVEQAAWDAGLSGPGRLHALTVNLVAATPGEVASGGSGLVIRYGVSPSPFGNCVVALTGRGLCGLGFCDDDGSLEVARLQSLWPKAGWHEDRAVAEDLVRQVFVPLHGAAQPLSVFVRGTNLQLQVWEALLRLPPAAATSYSALAHALGRPGAARSVASAVAANPVAVLIPCHRVIRSTGIVGEYHWGSRRKRALLAWESLRRDTT